jgi:hypothetical protein
VLAPILPNCVFFLFRVGSSYLQCREGSVRALTPCGTTIHISVSHTNTTTRTVNKILHFLKASSSGTSEAHTTIQQIRFITRFLAYLIRKGLSTFSKYGTKPITILNKIIFTLHAPIPRTTNSRTMINLH